MVLDLVQNENGLYIALAVVLLTSVLMWLLLRSSGTSRDTILLLGLCDSGKTLLFSLLSSRKSVKTLTSIQENTGQYVPNADDSKPGKSFKVVDLPGHERLRAKFLYKHKDGARGIIFVIDSVNFAREARDCAEVMYDMFASKTMKSNKVSILVACNKQDVPMAKASGVVKSQLEKELNALRKTRSAALLDVEDKDSTKDKDIGKAGVDFEFSHVLPIKVSFCECNLHPVAGEEKPR